MFRLCLKRGHIDTAENKDEFFLNPFLSHLPWTHLRSLLKLPHLHSFLLPPRQQPTSISSPSHSPSSYTDTHHTCFQPHTTHTILPPSLLNSTTTMHTFHCTFQPSITSLLLLPLSSPISPDTNTHTNTNLFSEPTLQASTYTLNIIFKFKFTHHHTIPTKWYIHRHNTYLQTPQIFIHANTFSFHSLLYTNILSYQWNTRAHIFPSPEIFPVWPF